MVSPRSNGKHSNGADALEKSPLETWGPQFLESLTKTYSVALAAKAAGVRRQHVYDARDRHQDFREAWDEVTQTTIDSLQLSAFRRAVEGTIEPLIYKGKPVMHTAPDGKEVILYVRRYETALTIFMLKALRPEVFHLERMQVDEGAAFEQAKRIRAAVDEIESAVPEAPETGGVVAGDAQ